jgi:GNAT superfamily N-acetyltransferase
MSEGGGMGVEVRAAGEGDLGDLAAMRWEWHLERGREATGERSEFESAYAAWWSQRSDRFRAVIARDGADPVGMGVLALVDRVPKPGALDRQHGDIQSMYVAPAYRDRGVGSQIVAVLLDLARDAGCVRVEVHSGRRAVPFYERAGFEHDRQLLDLSWED